MIAVSRLARSEYAGFDGRGLYPLFSGVRGVGSPLVPKQMPEYVCVKAEIQNS